MFVLELPVALDSAVEARRRLSAEIGPVPIEALEDAKLMTTELITNAVQHGQVPSGGRIEVRGYRTARRLRVEVVHRGAGLPGGYRPRAPSPRASSGWGLFLVERIADRWGFSGGSEDSCVWFEIDLV